MPDKPDTGGKSPSAEPESPPREKPVLPNAIGHRNQHPAKDIGRDIELHADCLQDDSTICSARLTFRVKPVLRPTGLPSKEIQRVIALQLELNLEGMGLVLETNSATEKEREKEKQKEKERDKEREMSLRGTREYVVQEGECEGDEGKTENKSPERQRNCKANQKRKAPVPFDYTAIAMSWNAVAADQGFSRIRVNHVSNSRRRKLKRRWLEWDKASEGKGPQAVFDTVLAAIAKSPFLRDKAWFDFWWLLAGDRHGNDNWLKVVEGKYRMEDTYDESVADRVRRVLGEKEP